MQVLERSFNTAAAQAVLEEGLVRYDWPGHTRQIAHLPYCHEGRYSAGYYAFGTLLDRLDHGTGLEILRALAELQITEPAHPHYGGFRWYREEAEIQDSNAAFFILMPILTVRFCYPEAYPKEHIEVIDGMLAHAAVWFSRECREPQIYYPNKIMSDGAMLLAVSSFLGQERYLEEGIRFYERWEDYTERRGWGWGENISLVYQSVMMNALRIAGKAVRDRNRVLAARLDARMEELKGILRFHDGEELVPSIRSYNFKGETRRKSLLWAIAGVSKFREVCEEVYSLNDLVTLLLFETEFAGEGAAASEQPVPRTRTERVFDRSYAASWIGGNVRLGSINRFPVIPGSYQWPTWGLGWQSFPVSFSVKDRQVSYLRWHVDLGDEVRTHPGLDYKTSYLKPALFREPYYPEVETRSAQAGPAALIIRSMSGVNHQVKELADEWVVHRFDGELMTFMTENGAREWTVLVYPHAAVAITALAGIPSGSEARTFVQVETHLDGEELRIRQVLHAGEAGAVLRHPRLEAGWAMLCLDGAGGEDRIRSALEAVRLTDRMVDDREVPRVPYTLKRHASLVTEEGNWEAVLELDPHVP